MRVRSKGPAGVGKGQRNEATCGQVSLPVMVVVRLVFPAFLMAGKKEQIREEVINGYPPLTHFLKVRPLVLHEAVSVLFPSVQSLALLFG